jgi:hypothetical protein
VAGPRSTGFCSVRSLTPGSLKFMDCCCHSWCLASFPHSSFVFFVRGTVLAWRGFVCRRDGRWFGTWGLLVFLFYPSFFLPCTCLLPDSHLPYHTYFFLSRPGLDRLGAESHLGTHRGKRVTSVGYKRWPSNVAVSSLAGTLRERAFSTLGLSYRI